MLSGPKPPWPSFRGNPRNTGTSAHPDLAPGGKLAAAPADLPVRRFATGNSIFSTPVVSADETVLVGSADGIFYAFDPLEGRERWRFKTGECIDSAACLARDGAVVVPSCDARIYALDAASGRERWRLDVLGERPRFTPSTIYWFEGNVVEGPGPEGLLFAGGDDFWLYAIEPASGRIRFAVPTGLHIWTAPAFGADGSAVFVSFDLFAYSIDAATGAERWRRNVGTFVASSPAIAADGTIWFGGFDGVLRALEPAGGEVVAQVPTGGAIYASPAIAPDGAIHVGSADGLFRSFDTAPDRRGALRWSFATGDPIRSSAAIGPDPEGRAPYLVYVGGGNGLIYAFDPSGARRWSFDTVAGSGGVDYPNINASIALGRHGLATATAGGEVVYVPYARYLAPAAEPGFSRRPDDGYPREGAFFFAVSPGGRPAAEPLPASVPGDAASDGPRAAIHPGETVTLRAVLRRDGRTVEATIDPETLRVAREPAGPLRVTLQADRTQANVLPEAIARDGEPFTLRASATLVAAEGRVPVEGALAAQVAPAGQAPPAARLVEMPFRVARMAIHSPSIVPSFDQIGIASLRLDARIVHADADGERVAGFGILKFGRSEAGEIVGAPIPRHLLYPFAGRYRAGHLVLEAAPCRFELTSGPVPLDRLRLAASLDARGAPALGASLHAEVAVPSFSLAGTLAAARSGLARVGRAIDILRAGSPGGSFVRSIPEAARFLGRALPLAREVLSGRLVRPFGLLDDAGRFVGAGTFKAEPLPASALAMPVGFRLSRLEHDARGRRIVAEVDVDPGAPPRPDAVLAIVLVDVAAGAPVPLDLDAASALERDPAGNPRRATLALPAAPESDGPRRVRALALLDLAIAGEAALEVPLSPPPVRHETT